MSRSQLQSGGADGVGGDGEANSRAPVGFGPITASLQARAEAIAKVARLRDNVRAPSSLPRQLADRAIKHTTRSKYLSLNVRAMEWFWAMTP